MSKAQNLPKFAFGASVASVVLAAFPLGLAAQERVSPELFLDFALGKTLTFETFPGGQLVGLEEYLRRGLSVWRDRSDTCVYGQVTVEEGQICFLYDNDDDGEPICWITFLEGERWFVLSTNGRRTEIQQITKVTEDGLDCPENPGV